MTRAKTITAHVLDNTNTQRIIFRVLLSGLIVLSVVYIYLIGSITFNVLARKALESQSRALGSHVSGLELTYLNQTNRIDKAYATSLGFVDVHTNIFAARIEPTRVAVR